MLEINKAISLVVLTLSVWSALHLLLDRRGNSQINRWFSALIFSLCVPQLYFYSLTLVPQGWLTLAALSQSAIWLKGPLLITFVGLVFNKASGRAFWHFIPFIVVIPLFLFVPKFAWWASLFGLLHGFVYAICAIALLIENKSKLEILYGNFKNSSWYWLLFVVAGLGVILLVDIALIGLRLYQQYFNLALAQVLTLTMSVYMLGVALFSIFRPTVFFHSQRMTDDGVTAADTDSDNPQATKSSRPARELSEEVASELLRHLATAMEADQVYLQNDLSLKRLGAKLGITSHQASELLNVYLGVGFYDYINGYRVRYACELLSDSSRQLRIIDIAFAAGFSNKNSFYRAFKELLNVTPVEYREQTQSASTIKPQAQSATAV